MGEREMIEWKRDAEYNNNYNNKNYTAKNKNEFVNSLIHTYSRVFIII